MCDKIFSPKDQATLSLQIPIQEPAALLDRRGAAQPRGAGAVEGADRAGALRRLWTD